MKKYKLISCNNLTGYIVHIFLFVFVYESKNVSENYNHLLSQFFYNSDKIIIHEGVRRRNEK